MNSLENSLRVREEECTALRNQAEAQRDEINDLRQRLSLPFLPPPDTGLGSRSAEQRMVRVNTEGRSQGAAMAAPLSGRLNYPEVMEVMNERAHPSHRVCHGCPLVHGVRR
jgi:hypothetical protein